MAEKNLSRYQYLKAINLMIANFFHQLMKKISPSTHVANASFDSDSNELDEDVSEESSRDDTIDDIHVNPVPPARKKLRQSKTNVQWKHCQTSNALNVPCNDLDEFSDPIDFFRHFFTDCILEQFIGILLMMSIVKMPRPRDYWAAETRHA